MKIYNIFKVKKCIFKHVIIAENQFYTYFKLKKFYIVSYYMFVIFSAYSILYTFYLEEFFGGSTKRHQCTRRNFIRL